MGILNTVRSDETPETQPLSEHEERAWLRQHQAPSTPFSQVMAFRLVGDLDVVKFGTSLEKVVRDTPHLMMLYRFDDDGLLTKSPIETRTEQKDTRHGFILQPAATLPQALNALLAEQCRPWSLEQEIPIRFALFPITPRETILGIILHHILDGAISWTQFFANVARSYDGLPIATSAEASGDQERPDIPDLCWFRRSPGTSTLEFFDRSRTSWLAPKLRERAGARYGAVLDPSPLKRLTEGNTTPRALLSAATILFGQYLLRLSADPMLKINVIDEGVELGVPLAGYRDLRLRLRPGDDLEEAVRRLRNGGETYEGSATASGVVITWLSDPTDMLTLTGLAVERIPLPPLDAGRDVALGLALNDDGRLAVDLATGPDLSPTVGAFVLEQFIAFIHGDDAEFPALIGAGLGGQNALSDPTDGSPLVENITPLILEQFRLALDNPNMGPDDDFFDFGGHSLIATRVIGRLLGEHRIQVEFNDLFSHPTAAGLAQLARRQQEPGASTPSSQQASASPSLPMRVSPFAKADGKDISSGPPLSLAQQSLWKIYAAFGYGEIFNIPFGLRFLDGIDERLFERAFLDILERHPVLRSLFIDQHGEVRQVEVPIPELEHYKWFWTSQESDGLEERSREAAYRFDLSRELPLRLRFMIDSANGQQVLSLLFHHIVLDEWSVNLLMDELDFAYRCRSSGRTPQWKNAPLPFHDFAVSQQSSGLSADHLDYWTTRLQGVAGGVPLFGQSKPPASDVAGGWVELKLDSATVDGLYVQAKNTGASLFNVVYAAIVASLRFLGAPEDLAVGTSAAGRTDPAFFDTIGYFTTVVCHRIHISDEVTIGNFIAHVRDTVNGSMPYTDVPIDLVEEALGHNALESGGHMFEVFIQLHAKNKLNGAFTLEDGRRIVFRQIDPDKSESFLGLQFEVMEETVAGERVIRVMMSYRSDHYDNEQVDAIRHMIGVLLSRFATADAMQPLASLQPSC